MAIIAGHYVWVASEELDTPIEATAHPVESGIDITTHIKPKPSTLSVSGEMVGANHGDLVAFYRALARQGYILSYIGRVVFPNCYIASFSTRASYKIKDGVEFDMTLKEMRIARKNYESRTGYSGDLVVSIMNYDGTVLLENLSDRRERFHTVMAGETLYFIAEQYRSRGVSVDAVREANRGRDIFRAGHQGDYNYLMPGVSVLLGVW